MVQRITITPRGSELSRFMVEYWRLMDWSMSVRQLANSIEERLGLGVTTVNHADIYGGYQCETAFGKAAKLTPHLREKMQIVAKCGIATTARTKNALGYYITNNAHTIASAEESLRLLTTNHIDLLLIYRPGPLMDVSNITGTSKKLYRDGKVCHSGISNSTPTQFSLLQSRLPFTLTTNQVEISLVHQPFLLDGASDQLQQLYIRPMAWSRLGGNRLFNDDAFQPLRNELAVIIEELSA